MNGASSLGTVQPLILMEFLRNLNTFLMRCPMSNCSLQYSGFIIGLSFTDFLSDLKLLIRNQLCMHNHCTLSCTLIFRNEMCFLSFFGVIPAYLFINCTPEQ